MPWSRHIAVAAAGFISLVLQSVLLRELLTASSGNELDIGITLAIWLLSVGAGSFTGEKVSARWAFGASFILLSAMAVPTLWAIPHVLEALGIVSGETVSLKNTFLLTLIVLLPVCFVVGLQFPLAVAVFREEVAQDGQGAQDGHVSLVYGLEALGAFAGGLVFAFVISGRLMPEVTVASIGVLAAITGAVLLGRKELFAACLLPLAAFAALIWTAPYEWMGGEIITRAQSRYSEILVTKRDNQYNFFSSGKPAFSYPDSETVEMAVHLPMALHPNPYRVLNVGGSPAQVSQYLMYEVDGVDFVEMDPMMLKLSIGALDGADSVAIEDKRVRVIVEDGRSYIKSISSPMYDLIVVNLPGPENANLNRFYTVEFFREAASVLREGGMLAIRIPTSRGYVSRRMKLANGTVLRSLSEAFENVALSTEEYGLLAASRDPIDTKPSALVRRLRWRDLSGTSYFREFILDDAFSVERVQQLRERLEKVESINSDMRPLAYLYNLMLWSEMHGSRWLAKVLEAGPHAATIAGGFFLLLGLAAYGSAKRTIYYSVSVAGFSAMGFLIVIMLGFQALYGYVYEMFALLSALFMVGMSAGAIFVRFMRVKGPRTLNLALAFDILTAALAVIAAFVLDIALAVYVVSLLAGILSGAQFAAVSTAYEQRGFKSAGGRLYAIDLAGSFVGALVFAIVIVPVAGLWGALLLVAVVKVFSAVLIGRVRNA